MYKILSVPNTRLFLYTYIYIYIYKDREREGESERERVNEREREREGGERRFGRDACVCGNVSVYISLVIRLQTET